MKTHAIGVRNQRSCLLAREKRKCESEWPRVTPTSLETEGSGQPTVRRRTTKVLEADYGICSGHHEEGEDDECYSSFSVFRGHSEMFGEGSSQTLPNETSICLRASSPWHTASIIAGVMTQSCFASPLPELSNRCTAPRAIHKACGGFC